MKDLQPPDNPLNQEQKRFLLQIAREAVESAVCGKSIPRHQVTDPRLLEKRGAFVTLYHGDELRGCLGQFDSDEPLWLTVADRARASATYDPRFSPVECEEVRDITIDVSALTPLHRASSPEEIVVGKHGIYLIKGMRRGTLLPQVAIENSWNREEFLRYTCRKAGLPPDGWKEGCEIYLYEADVFSEREIPRN